VIVVHRSLRTRKDVPQQGEYRPLDSLTPVSTRRALDLEETTQIAFQSFGPIRIDHHTSAVEIQFESRCRRHCVARDEHRHDRRATAGSLHEFAAYPVRRLREPREIRGIVPTRADDRENDSAVPDCPEESALERPALAQIKGVEEDLILADGVLENRRRQRGRERLVCPSVAD